MKKRYPFLPKTWLRFGLAVSIAASFSINLQAQNAPVKQWDKTFGGNAYEYAPRIIQTSDGGFILGGHSNSSISGNKTQIPRGDYDYWVIKIDPSGNKIWDKTLGGIGYDLLRSLRQTADGGYILGGSSISYANGDKSQPTQGGLDFWIIKLDGSGNKVWDKDFGGNYDDNLTCLQQTSDGGYILGGSSSSSINGDKSQPNRGLYHTSDYWIIKLDANGNKIWDKTYGGSENDGLLALQQTSDGGYILGGSSWSTSGPDKTQPLKGGVDYWVIKLDSNGNKSWDKVFGTNGDEYFTSLQQVSDGGYIIGGTTESGIGGDKTHANKGLDDYWIIKIDANGNKSWDKTIGGSGPDALYALQQTSDGSYIFGGSSQSPISGDKSQASQGSADCWLIKLDSFGNKQWDKTLGGSAIDFIYSLQPTSDGGFIVAGNSNSGIGGDKSEPCQGSTDFWIVKLAADVLSTKEPKASFNLAIFPNPNQGKFKLQLSNLTAPKAEVTISDLLGRVVLQKELQATNNQLSEELNLPNSKGIYLLQLKAGEQIITRKIVVE